MPYRVDFHAHTGHSSDCLLPAARLLGRAIERGLTAIAVTDHNSLGGALQASALVRNDPQFAGLLVIPGEEVRTTEGEIIGLFLAEPIPRGLTPEDSIERIRRQGGLVLVPHPFDRFRGSRITEAAVERIAPLVDAIEVFNARTTLDEDDRRAREFARRHGLPAVGGSDSHVVQEVGNGYLELDEPPTTDPQSLLAQIRTGRIGGRRSSPLVHAGSKLAKWRKRLGLAPMVQL